MTTLTFRERDRRELIELLIQAVNITSIERHSAIDMSMENATRRTNYKRLRL